MLDVSQLLQKLGKFYWSPETPEHYVLRNGKGLGSYASKSYGTFNVIWASHLLMTEQDHVFANYNFRLLAPKMEQTVQDMTLADRATLYDRASFVSWYKLHCSLVDSATRPYIDKVIYAMEDIHRI